MLALQEVSKTSIRYKKKRKVLRYYVHILLKREIFLYKGITRIHTSSKNRSKRKEQILGQQNRD